MPRIIIKADLGPSSRTLLDEKVDTLHIDDEHASVQLMERVAWAIADAEESERTLAP